MRRAVLTVSLGLAGLFASAPAASAAQTITSPGPLTSIFVNDDLRCGVERAGESQVFSGDHCGTFLAVGTDVYGPVGLAPTDNSFAPVNQTSVTGSGTMALPYQVVTEVDAGADLTVTQTDSYVVGQDFYSSEVEVTNDAVGDQVVKLYHAADCLVRGDDTGYGFASGGNAYCSRQPNNLFSGLLGFEPVTLGGNHFFEAEFDEVWSAVDGSDLFDSCECGILQDNGVGINWSFNAPGGGGTVTREFRTRVSPDLTDPDTGISGGPTGTTADRTPTFNFTSNEPGVTFRCRVDAGALVPCSSTHTTPSLGDGPHTLRAVALDHDANEDPTPATRSFTVAATASAPPVVPVPAPPVGLPPPQTRKTFNSSVKSGTVTVKCPGDSKFRGIEGDNSLSFRCLVDTRKGRLEITTTAAGGKTQSSLFYDGIFRAGQTRGSRPVTELKLAGKLQNCPRSGRSRAAGLFDPLVQDARRRRRGRRLWGRGRGRFRTRGRRGSASVRGTTWLVEDRCNSTTFFKVTSGRVAVRDFARRKTINLRRGQSYVAKPRRRR